MNSTIKKYRLINIHDREDYSLGEKILLVELSPIEIFKSSLSYAEILINTDTFIYLLNEPNKNKFLSEPEEIKEINLQEFSLGIITLPDGSKKNAYKHNNYLSKKREKYGNFI